MTQPKIINKSSLLTPSAALKAFPDTGLTAAQLGYAVSIGAVRAAKIEDRTMIEPSSLADFLEFRKEQASAPLLINHSE